MTLFQFLYKYKDSPELCSYTDLCLTYQIYSPNIIRFVAANWDKTPAYLKENTPAQIQSLITLAHTLSDQDIQQQLNQYHMCAAVQILQKYQTCPMPLPERESDESTSERYNLLSKQGESALTILEKAIQNNQFTNQMAQLAIQTSHKFLLNLKYYKKWDIDPNTLLRTFICKDQDESTITIFPVVQLTKGCINQCSHCLMRAESQLTHMPYPMFLSIHNTLWQTYKHMPMPYDPRFQEDNAFYKFFYDSDSLSYHDSIIGADAGDVHLNLLYQEKPFCLMTRGVTNQISKLAFAKLVNANLPLVLSFVDTPLEDKTRALKQLNETLDIAEKYIKSRENLHIHHLHLKSGVSFTDDIFRDFPVEKVQIYRAGRAKQFPVDELMQVNDLNFLTSIVIEPNGRIVSTRIRNLEHVSEPIGAITKNAYVKDNFGKKLLRRLANIHMR